MFLSDHVPWLTRSQAQRLVRDGKVCVNGTPMVRPSTRLEAGDTIVAELPPAGDPLPQAVPIPINVVYEDDHLAIVDKPPGLTVHPGPGHVQDTLVNALLARFANIETVGEARRPGIVHRLDKDTSGLLIVAKTSSAHEAMSAAIRNRLVTRRYITLVHGLIEPGEGVVDAPVGRHPVDRTRQAIVEGGKSARTRYRVERRMNGASLLSIWLETGRMHQIRVHMASIGHPVVGDSTYGRKRHGVPCLCRQFLHSTELRFKHPFTGEIISATSPLPSDLKEALTYFES